MSIRSADSTNMSMHISDGLLRRSSLLWLANCAAVMLLLGASSLATAGEDAKKPEVTFAKDVSRILQERCQTCHHKGTAAPFSLLTYEDAKRKAKSIRDAV